MTVPPACQILFGISGLYGPNEVELVKLAREEVELLVSMVDSFIKSTHGTGTKLKSFQAIKERLDDLCRGIVEDDRIRAQSESMH